MKLKYDFASAELLEQALTHKSFANENRNLGAKDNERLEFLGDAVLDLILSEILMKAFPEEDEGGLSKRRASLVNEGTLGAMALGLGISEKLRLGKGEDASAGRTKPRILASTLEAVIGAIFLDSGYEAAKKVAEDLFQPLVSAQPATDFDRDYKTRLQELCQKVFNKVPQYQLMETTGPEHEKEFRVQVIVENRVLGEGVGKTKKQAEQKAAEKALEVVS